MTRTQKAVDGGMVLYWVVPEECLAYTEGLYSVFDAFGFWFELMATRPAAACCCQPLFSTKTSKCSPLNSKADLPGSQIHPSHRTRMASYPTAWPHRLEELVLPRRWTIRWRLTSRVKEAPAIFQDSLEDQVSVEE